MTLAALRADTRPALEPEHPRSALAFWLGAGLAAAWFAGSLWPEPAHPGRFCLLAEGSEVPHAAYAARAAPVAAGWRCGR